MLFNAVLEKPQHWSKYVPNRFRISTAIISACIQTQHWTECSLVMEQHSMTAANDESGIADPTHGLCGKEAHDYL